MEEVVKEFLAESRENLQRMEHGLLELEKDSTNREILADIFRTIHTIKGTCGFLEFSKLESLTHISENLLSLLRNGEMSLDSSIASALLSLVDKVRQFLDNIESSGSDAECDASELCEQLSRLAEQRSSKALAPDEQDPSDQAPPTGSVPPESSSPPPEQGSAQQAGAAVTKPRRRKRRSKKVSKTQTVVASEQEHPAAVQQQTNDDDDIGTPVIEQFQDAPAQQQAAPGTAGAVVTASVRVDVSLLENLMAMVGELVLVRNQIIGVVAEREDPGLSVVTQRLNVVTSALQEAVMRTRMQPIDNIFRTFPRLIRDMALACDKKVRLTLTGEETELDRTIIEAIKDPLTHLARNAVDHGLESAEQRLALGKPEEGHVRLRASHENSQVIIEISDDGSGVDIDAIAKRAQDLGIMTAEQMGRVSRQETLNMIFAPGLSTANRVTSVSGRGVGMDVVRTNIERVGGTVDLQSSPGKGTSFLIRLPLTLAIMPALIVRSCGERFAIPQSGLVELVRLDGEDAGSNIEFVHEAPVFRLRDKLLPILRLDEELKLLPDERPSQQPTKNLTIVVLRAADKEFGLIVDRLEETQEIVVKPLNDLLKPIAVLAGTTILGDGAVALILDVLGFAQRTHVVTESTEWTTAGETAVEDVVGSNQEKMLYFASQDDGRMAISLEHVSRLAEFSRAKIEKAGDYDVIQYGSEILPLLYVDQLLPERRARPRGPAEAEEDDKLQLVVYAGKDRDVGLVVSRIIDIVEEPVTVQNPGSRAGVLGTAVIRDRVTELLDLEGIIKKFDPSFIIATSSVGMEG